MTILEQAHEAATETLIIQMSVMAQFGSMVQASDGQFHSVITADRVPALMKLVERNIERNIATLNACWAIYGSLRP